MSKKECNICLGEKTNFITCQYCNVEACNECQQKYILERSIPGCMNCKKEWTYNWLREHFPKHFMNKTYKLVKENQLFEIEKTMLPALQNEVAFELKYSEELEFYEELLRKISKCKKLSCFHPDELKENDKEVIKDMHSFYSYKLDSKFIGKDFFTVWKKWKDEPEDVKNRYYSCSRGYVFSWKLEARTIKSIIKSIKKIIETKVDLKVLQDIFGNFYNYWNVKYNQKTNVIVGNIYFSYKNVIWDKYVYSFFKKFFGVDVSKGEEYKENEIVNPVFNIYLNDENVMILEFLNKDYNITDQKEELREFLILNSKNKKSNFSRPCPKNECRGFFDNKWKCGLCNTRVCKDCHEALPEEDEKHTCNPDTVKSVKAMERETKSCPKCNILTYKISGCSQIWCTQCHTTWDWESGEIEKGRIHNPHYWEFMRQQGKEDEEVKRQFGAEGNPQPPPDNACFTFATLERYLGNSIFNNIFQIVNHLEMHDLNKFRVEEMENLNYELRKSYLKNEIDEKKFKTHISMKFKRNNFNLESRQIIEMYLNTIKDTVVMFFLKIGVQKLKPSRVKYTDTTELYKSLESLRKYVLTNLNKVCEIYGYVTPFLESLDEFVFLFLNRGEKDIKKCIESDIKMLEEAINFLIDLDFYKASIRNLTFELSKYGIRNPLGFGNNDIFLIYKTEKLNHMVDKLEDLKKLL